MATSPDPAALLSKKWTTLAIVGVAAVLAGLFLPQLLPSSTPEPKTTTEGSGKSGPFAYKAQEWPEPPSSQGMFVRLALGTLIVLGLCVGTVFLCKRWMGGA